MADIPNVPGVPPLGSFSGNNIALLVADIVSLLGAALGPQWGVFLDGEPVIFSDNTLSFAFKQDAPVSTYPVEEGGFQSYDKVQLPAEITLRVSAGGDISARQALLASIDAQFNTTDLYDILTPEKTFLSYNFTHQDYHRDATRGATLIAVDLHFMEIRVTTTATATPTNGNTLSNTASPTVAGQQNIGNVQPQIPDATVQDNFANVH